MRYTVGATQLYISWFLKVCIFTFGKNAGFIFAYLGNQYENCVAAIEAMRFSCAAPAAHFLYLQAMIIFNRADRVRAMRFIPTVRFGIFIRIIINRQSRRLYFVHTRHGFTVPPSPIAERAINRFYWIFRDNTEKSIFSGIRCD